MGDNVAVSCTFFINEEKEEDNLRKWFCSEFPVRLDTLDQIYPSHDFVARGQWKVTRAKYKLEENSQQSEPSYTFDFIIEGYMTTLDKEGERALCYYGRTVDYQVFYA